LGLPLPLSFSLLPTCAEGGEAKAVNAMMAMR